MKDLVRFSRVLLHFVCCLFLWRAAAEMSACNNRSMEEIAAMQEAIKLLAEIIP